MPGVQLLIMAMTVASNSEPSDFEHLGDRLTEIFKARAERALYVKADPDIEFRHVANAMDIAKGAGIQHIGLLGKFLPVSK
jgi:biopolymer transport protein ExbD